MSIMMILPPDREKGKKMDIDGGVPIFHKVLYHIVLIRRCVIYFAKKEEERRFFALKDIMMQKLIYLLC